MALVPSSSLSGVVVSKQDCPMMCVMVGYGNALVMQSVDDMLMSLETARNCFILCIFVVLAAVCAYTLD